MQTELRLTTPWGRRGKDRRGKNKIAAFGVTALLVMACIAILAPVISPYDPKAATGEPFEPPSCRHLLGTNDIGQDILSELIWGSRVSLLIGVLAALVAVTIGTAVGIVSGYFGGIVDMILMRLVDVILVIPFLPLMILLSAYLGPSFWNLIVVIGALVWARPARVIRSQVLSLRSRGYVQAAQSMRASHGYILTRHILPGVMSLGLAQFVLAASHTILIEASLSFLGLGDPLRKSWGTVLYYAQVRGAFLSGAWLWWVLPPGLLITLAVAGFAFSGYALENTFNPRLRKG